MSSVAHGKAPLSSHAASTILKHTSMHSLLLAVLSVSILVLERSRNLIQRLHPNYDTAHWQRMQL